MMSPLVTLNRRSCVIIHTRKSIDLKRSGPDPAKYSGSGSSGLRLGWPLNITAGVADGGRRLVARYDFIDTEEVLRVVLAIGLRLSHKGGCHQLMVALAVIDLV